MADETGAEAPDDEAEFASLKAAPRPRSPLTALAVVVLAVGLSWHLSGDLRYAFRPRTPTALGDARRPAAALEDDSYVTLSGVPDRRNALSIEPKGEQERQSFFRLLGTGTRLLVRALPAGRRLDFEERWTGRLRRFDTLPYASSIRDYYAHEVEAARYLPLDAFRAALSGGPTALNDRTGEPLKLTPETEMVVDAIVPNRIKVTLPTEKFPSELDARHELERLGLTFTQIGGFDVHDESFIYAVEAPAAQRDAVVGKLEGAGLAFAADARRHRVKLSRLKLVGDQIEIEGAPPAARRLSYAWLTAVSVDNPIVIPPDAWVLTEGEAPERFWWAPALAALLGAFVAFNVWYLVRARRAST
jgi:hypothetical protein